MTFQLRQEIGEEVGQEKMEEGERVEAMRRLIVIARASRGNESKAHAVRSRLEWATIQGLKSQVKTVGDH